jgi:hypothetical protein
MRRRVCVCYYPQKHDEYGAYNCLMRDLELHHSENFHNYNRVEPGKFEELQFKVEPLISNNLKTTNLLTYSHIYLFFTYINTNNFNENCLLSSSLQNISYSLYTLYLRAVEKIQKAIDSVSL